MRTNETKDETETQSSFDVTMLYLLQLLRCDCQEAKKTIQRRSTKRQSQRHDALLGKLSGDQHKANGAVSPTLIICKLNPLFSVPTHYA